MQLPLSNSAPPESELAPRFRLRRERRCARQPRSILPHPAGPDRITRAMRKPGMGECGVRLSRGLLGCLGAATLASGMGFTKPADSNAQDRGSRSDRYMRVVEDPGSPEIQPKNNNRGHGRDRSSRCRWERARTQFSGGYCYSDWRNCCNSIGSNPQDKK